MPESVLIEDDPDLDKEVRKAIPAEEMVAHFHKMIRSVAPHLEGLEAEKTALLAQLAGADSKQKKGGARFRGDINILIVGSPSAGKTEMLKYQSRIRPFYIGNRKNCLSWRTDSRNRDGRNYARRPTSSYQASLVRCVRSCS